VQTSGKCEQCESIPHAPDLAGVLHLRFPQAHTAGKVISALSELNLPFETAGLVLSVPVGLPAAAGVLNALASLSALEQEQARALVQPDAKANLTPADSLETTSVAALVARVQSHSLVAMIEERRLATAFQPILSAENGTTLFAHECLLRGLEGGQLVSPDKLFDLARRAGLLFQLDLAARQTAIRSAACYETNGKFFINFTPASIYDPTFCLRSTVRTLREHSLAPEQIVFEVVESDHNPDVGHLKEILEFYRAAGFGVALDDVGSGYSGLNMLHTLRPDYMKLDMQLIRGIDGDPYKALIAAKLLETAQALGMKTIAEGVETPGEHAWLRLRDSLARATA
jgi:EAL domain-containing protein (putative c-di-GMP-specific phosphodiesterase class I)